MQELVHGFSQGGPFMFVLLLAGLLHTMMVFTQLGLSKKIDLMPLLWAGLLGIILTGMLGSVSGMIQAFKAVAMASPEMKQSLLAAGVSISLYTTWFSLFLAAIGCFFTGVTGVVVRKFKTP